MVDLPTVPRRLATLEAPPSNLSSAEVAAPYSELARALDKTGDAAGTVANSLAEQAGYNAVTRDAAGNIQVEQAPIIGPASKHYHDAVKMAALAEGEGAARRADIDLRTKFRNDPDGYLKAAEQFAAGMEQQYSDAAGPDVGIALRRAIEPVTTQTYKGLLNEKERLDLHRAVNSIDAEIEATKNQMYGMARGGVTSGPEWNAANDKIRTLYNSLGTNPRLAYPQEKINNELSQFDSELRVQGLTHAIVDNVYPSKGYDDALKTADKIRTDPGLNLTPAQREASYHRVVADLNSRARDDYRAVTGIAREIKSVNDMASDGYSPTPERMGQLRAAVSTSKVPGLAGALDATETTVATMRQWSTMNPVQLETSLADLDRKMREGGATEQGIALKDTGEKLLKNMRKEIGADPLGWADRTSVVKVPPIQFGSPDGPSQMTDRVTRAEAVAKHYGVAPTYLRPDEKSSLEVAAAKGGDTMLGMARTLADGFGDRAPAVMAEISKDAPALAHVGALVSSGGNPAFAVDVADAVKLRQDKDFKMPRWLEHPNDKILAAQGGRTREVYGGAFALAPDSGRAAEKAAQDAFFSRANRNGYEPLLEQSASKKAYDRALQESAGAKFTPDGTQYGGIGDYKPGYWINYKTLIPPNVKADSFGQVIGAIKDEDLSKMAISPMTADGRAYTAADIKSAVAIAVKGGYRFALGDPTSDDPKFIRGADGRPFVLDLDQMETELRKRVPRAYLGGR